MAPPPLLPLPLLRILLRDKGASLRAPRRTRGRLPDRRSRRRGQGPSPRPGPSARSLLPFLPRLCSQKKVAFSSKRHYFITSATPSSPCASASSSSSSSSVSYGSAAALPAAAAGVTHGGPSFVQGRWMGVNKPKTFVPYLTRFFTE